MFFKVQFIKCALCIVLYFVVCVILIRMKRNFDLKETIGETIIKRLQTRLPISNISKKNIELEINMLRMDELNGETIDVQVCFENSD